MAYHSFFVLFTASRYSWHRAIHVTLFQTDCVKDVQLKKKQFTYPNGKVRDFNLCFIHFKESDFSQDVLDSCLADLNGADKHFVIKPYEDEDTFWKVFLAIKKTHKSPSPVLIRK